jgi:hypothetical protein
MALDPDRFKEQLNVVHLFFWKVCGLSSSFGASLTFTWRHWDYHYNNVWNLPEWEPLGHCLSKAGAVARFGFNLRGPCCHGLNKEFVMENNVVQCSAFATTSSSFERKRIENLHFLATFSGAHIRKCNNGLPNVFR